MRWLRNPHLQTVLASRVFRPCFIETCRERIELPDGDFIDIDLSTRAHGDVVAIFHGLAGCVQSSYVQGAFQSLEHAGFRPALMNWRGCSGEPNRLARSYHSGASDDIRWFIDYLAARYPDSRLFALGYSLGANALLKYLGESSNTSTTGSSITCPNSFSRTSTGDSTTMSATAATVHAQSAAGLAGAMAVSPPLVLAEGANRLNQGLARVYQKHLLSLMRRQHEQKRKCYPELHLPAATARLDTFWKFDDCITAPLHGYAGVHDYYERCSARRFLPMIDTPTHILCARDDPFFTPRILPEADELASDTTLELTDTGGHVGFLRGRERWLDQHVADVLKGFSRAGC
jgi:predicted alpha/beta-fold hydrolase